MDEIKVNVEEIMAEIRASLREEAANDPDPVMREILAEAATHSAPDLPDFGDIRMPEREEGEVSSICLQNRNEAEYLKASYRISYFRELGGGPKGAVKRVVRKLGKGIILPMREEQDDFNLHVANSVDGLRIVTEQLSQEAGTQRGLLDTNAMRTEQLTEQAQQLQENTDQLLGTVDQLMETVERQQRQLQETVERQQRQLQETADGFRAQIAELQGYIGTLQAQMAEKDRKQKALEKELDTLSMNVSRTVLSCLKPEQKAALTEEKAAPAEEKPAPAAEIPAEVQASGAQENKYQAMDYFGFQNEFRGTQADIMDRQRIYLPYFRNRSGKIYDLGCGRGEFLRLLKEENIPAFGMDMYPEYVVTGKLYDIDIRQGDGIALMEGMEEKLGGIFCAQVIEHIGFDNIGKMCRLAFDRLEEGGWLVLETPNPMCVSTMTNAFYIDPTHERPVHPLLMEYLLKSIGFREVQLLFPDHSLERLPHIESESIGNLDQVNRAIDRLSDFLFGSQDYAVIGRK